METTEIRKSPVREMLGCALPIFWAGIICFSYPGIMTTYWQERYHVGSTETGLVLTFMLVALAVSMFFSGKIPLFFSNTMLRSDMARFSLRCFSEPTVS